MAHGKRKPVLWDKPVSKTTDGYNVVRLLTVVFYLAAQTVDIDHDSVIIYCYTSPPDLFVDHILGVDLAGML